MNARLTLGEKLKDLRTAKKLKLDEDEYLRYRISERFNLLMLNLFEAHKKDKLPSEQAEVIADMKESVKTYLDTQKTEEANKAKAIVMCKQLGLNTSKLDDEEWRVLMKVLENAKPVKRANKRK